MKTTIEINDALLGEAQARAAADRTTLRSLVETALRKELKQRESRQPYRMPSLGHNFGGLQPEFEGATFADLLEESYRGCST